MVPAGTASFSAERFGRNPVPPEPTQLRRPPLRNCQKLAEPAGQRRGAGPGLHDAAARGGARHAHLHLRHRPPATLPLRPAAMGELRPLLLGLEVGGCGAPRFRSAVWKGSPGGGCAVIGKPFLRAVTGRLCQLGSSSVSAGWAVRGRWAPLCRAAAPRVEMWGLTRAKGRNVLSPVWPARCGALCCSSAGSEGWAVLPWGTSWESDNLGCAKLGPALVLCTRGAIHTLARWCLSAFPSLYCSNKMAEDLQQKLDLDHSQACWTVVREGVIRLWEL